MTFQRAAATIRKVSVAHRCDGDGAAVVISTTHGEFRGNGRFGASAVVARSSIADVAHDLRRDGRQKSEKNKAERKYRCRHHSKYERMLGSCRDNRGVSRFVRVTVATRNAENSLVMRTHRGPTLYCTLSTWEKFPKDSKKEA